MTVFARSYPSWKAPTEDGQVLISPSKPDLVQHLRQARGTRLAAGYEAIRADARRFLNFDSDRPVIATGHQIELHHPGVWVKNILINELASAADGEAMHLAVDTDEPKHLTLRWPGGSIPITDDPALTTAAWSGLVDLPTPQHLQNIRNDVESAARDWDFEPVLPQFLDTIQRLLLEAPNLVHAVTNATHKLEWELGLRHHVMIASPLWASRAFTAFAYDVFANLGEFAWGYNMSLAEYRAAAGIKSPGRPMPDLKISNDAGEAPFWIDDLTSAQRVRASARRVDGNWGLELRDERFEFDASLDPLEGADRLLAFLRKHNHRLAPRAITLTMFMRLFVCDLFVHGIGGGQYDQVTDRLIARRYKIDPSPFAVTTATLYFPAAAGRMRTCVPCVQADGRKIRHGVLGQRKLELVNQIASLPRGSAERRSLFFDMHRQMADAAISSDALQQWQTNLQAAQLTEREEASVFDRELFFAIQPRQRLEHLIAAYR